MRRRSSGASLAKLTLCYLPSTIALLTHSISSLVVASLRPLAMSLISS